MNMLLCLKKLGDSPKERGQKLKLWSTYKAYSYEAKTALVIFAVVASF